MQHRLQTNQCRLVKRLTEVKESHTKMADSSIQMRLMFLDLLSWHKIQTHCNGKEKQLIFALKLKM